MPNVKPQAEATSIHDEYAQWVSAGFELWSLFAPEPEGPAIDVATLGEYWSLQPTELVPEGPISYAMRRLEDLKADRSLDVWTPPLGTTRRYHPDAQC